MLKNYIMKKWMMIIAMGIIFYSCNTLKLATDYDKTVDFTQYNSIEYFGWDQESDTILNRFDKEKIEAAFSSELRKRGFQLADKGQGDLILSLHIVSKQKVQTTASSHSMYGYGGYYGYGPMYRWGPGYTTTTINEYEYTEGTLVVSVYDAANELLLWQTAGTATIDWGDRKNEKAINYIVSRMMMQYPKAK